MKLNEMFDKERSLSDFEREREEMLSRADRETSIGDMIISQFEAGEISFKQARQNLLDRGLGEWLQELNMADELLKGRAKMH